MWDMQFYSLPQTKTGNTQSYMLSKMYDILHARFHPWKTAYRITYLQFVLTFWRWPVWGTSCVLVELQLWHHCWVHSIKLLYSFAKPFAQKQDINPLFVEHVSTRIQSPPTYGCWSAGGIKKAGSIQFGYGANNRNWRSRKQQFFLVFTRRTQFFQTTRQVDFR